MIITLNITAEQAAQLAAFFNIKSFTTSEDLANQIMATAARRAAQRKIIAASATVDPVKLAEFAAAIDAVPK